MADDVRDKLRRRYDELEATPPLDKLRGFLGGTVCHNSMDEVRADVRRRLAGGGPMPGAPIRHALEGLDFVLGGGLPPGALSRLVALDANHVIDDPSDEGARAWLEELAAFLREELEASGARTRWPGT